LRVLGTEISALLSYQEAYSKVMELIRVGLPAYVTVNNVHTVVEAVRSTSYQTVLNRSALALADGRPLSLLGRFKGVGKIARLFGPTFMERTLEWGAKDRLKHFFFGSSNETLEKLRRQLTAKYPNAEIVGMVSPPFRPFTKEENENYINEMANASPDIVWVSLGAPKQEIWMCDNYDRLGRGVMIGIGAGFDYVAGNIKHAPEWMKQMSLEWCFRLYQEPRRLWKRYLVTNTLFILYISLESLGLKQFSKNKGSIR
jgi:N-acetylglucosaminyldiphosphoundecaprenol N-acetyl-beta-D-mannosaminyltransferase